MKIIMTQDQGQHMLYKIGLSNALNKLGHKSAIIGNTSDILTLFHRDTPDVFFGSLKELDRPTLKAMNRFDIKYVMSIVDENELEKIKDVNVPFGLLTCYNNNIYSAHKTSCAFDELEAVNFEQKPINKDVVYIGENKRDKIDLFAQYLYPLVYPNTNLRVLIGGVGGFGSSVYVGPFNNNKNILDLYGSSVMSLNLTNSETVNYRIYQILGVGGICWSNMTKTIMDEFGQNGPVVFGDIKACLDFLKDESNRNEIVEQGKEYVKEHTFTKRAEEFLQYLD